MSQLHSHRHSLPGRARVERTLVVAATRGNQKTAVQIDGKDLYLAVNAYVFAEAKAK